jgi:DNA-binding transcriptional regulator YdaS (Cro superfamily)
MKTITTIRAWMASATPEEQELLAQKVGTTRGQLYQLSGGHRQASAAMAGKIESATAEMHKHSKGRLPKIMRTDVCEACRGCQYAAKCLGSRAVVSDFPIVSEKQMELPL